MQTERELKTVSFAFAAHSGAVEARTDDIPHSAPPRRQWRSALFGEEKSLALVWGKGHRERAAALTQLHTHAVTRERLEEDLDRLEIDGTLGEIAVAFGTWGMPLLTEAHLERMPRLQAVFYAGGSVQYFAVPLLERGITITSAWQANAVPVAEFTLAQILLANKGYWRNVQEYRTDIVAGRIPRSTGNYGESVALLGAGAVGRRLIELLRPFSLHITVFDPFLADVDARALGVEKVGLEEAFTRGLVVSNHLADNPQTAGMLTGALFERMRAGATFINTGRGRTVDEAGLVRVLQARPDLTALLDVTWPEPPLRDSPLWNLPNAHLTGHIAGSTGGEVARMADYALDEFERWDRSEPLRFAVTPALLETMA